MNELQIKNTIERTLIAISKQRIEDKFKSFEKIDIPLLTISYKRNHSEVSRKKIRMYLDLLDSWYPLYRNADVTTKAEFISDIFKCNCTKEQLEQLQAFKQITKKKVITMENERIKTISRLRWRGRDNLNRNIIHFQN